MDSVPSSKRRQADMPTACALVCSYLHNLREGGMIMLYKLNVTRSLAKCLLMKKAAKVFLAILLTSVMIMYAIFGHDIKWPKMASGIYLSTLVHIR